MYSFHEGWPTCSSLIASVAGYLLVLWLVDIEGFELLLQESLAHELFWCNLLGLGIHYGRLLWELDIAQWLNLETWLDIVCVVIAIAWCTVIVLVTHHLGAGCLPHHFCMFARATFHETLASNWHGRSKEWCLELMHGGCWDGTSSCWPRGGTCEVLVEVYLTWCVLGSSEGERLHFLFV